VTGDPTLLRRSALIGVGAGLAWLVSAGFLGLSALLAGYFSVVGFAVLAAWAIAAAIMGTWLLGHGTDARSQKVSVGAAALSSLVATGLALLPGTELLWSVVVLSGTAGLYSLIVIRRSGPQTE
jgi:hypothetical protein